MNWDEWSPELFKPWEEQSAAMLAWGLPAGLLPFMSFPYSLQALPQIPPQISLPEDWHPRLDPVIEMVLTGLGIGAGLNLFPKREVDLRWFAEANQTITSLWCKWAEPDALDGLVQVEDMTGLLDVMLPATPGRMELGHLPNLRFASVAHSDQLSVAGAPRLAGLGVTTPSIPARLEVRSTLETLYLHTKKVTLDSLGDLSGVRDLSIEGATTLDVTALRQCTNLQKLRIARSRSVTGLSALKECRNLRDVTLVYVRTVDDPSAILDLPLSRFDGRGHAFDEAFVEAARPRPGWHVTGARMRTVARTTPVIVTEASDGTIELAIRDFEWISAQAHDTEDELELVGDEVERMLRDYVMRTRPILLTERLVTFDCEAEAVIAIVPNSEVAAQLRRAMDELFLSKPRLRAALKRVQNHDPTLDTRPPG